MAPRYRVRASVGAPTMGTFNLRKSQRGSDGRFTAGSELLSIEAYRWPSVRSYTANSLAGQMGRFADEIAGWMEHVGAGADVVAYNALLPAFKQSQIYCPKDTLALVQSGKITKTPGRVTRTGRERKASVSITYGSNLLPYYAVFVHEILKYKHAPPTRAKFLESALREKMNTIEAALTSGASKLAGNK